MRGEIINYVSYSDITEFFFLKRRLTSVTTFGIRGQKRKERKTQLQRANRRIDTNSIRAAFVNSRLQRQIFVIHSLLMAMSSVICGLGIQIFHLERQLFVTRYRRKNLLPAGYVQYITLKR